MAGGGSISTMITSNNNNRNLQLSARKGFKMSNGVSSNSRNKLNFNTEKFGKQTTTHIMNMQKVRHQMGKDVLLSIIKTIMVVGVLLFTLKVFI